VNIKKKPAARYAFLFLSFQSHVVKAKSQNPCPKSPPLRFMHTQTHTRALETGVLRVRPSFCFPCLCVSVCDFRKMQGGGEKSAHDRKGHKPKRAFQPREESSRTQKRGKIAASSPNLKSQWPRYWEEKDDQINTHTHARPRHQPLLPTHSAKQTRARACACACACACVPVVYLCITSLAALLPTSS
jgi:hypothetical protein